MFKVYAIRSSINQRVYIGQTKDFDARLNLHNKGLVKSTKRDIPWELYAEEVFETREAARWCEYQLKKSKGRREKWLEDHKI